MSRVRLEKKLLRIDLSGGWVRDGKVYEAARSCGRGHNSTYRYVSTDACVECQKIHRKQRQVQIAEGLVAKATRPKPERCENCGKRTTICWHHDHGTGLFAAWLCKSCNFIEGHAHGDPSICEGIAHLLRTGIPVRATPGMSTLKRLVAAAQSWHGELAINVQ